MYCLVLTFSSCLICTLEILRFFQKLLDSWLSIFESSVHFFLFGKFVVACSKQYLCVY